MNNQCNQFDEIAVGQSNTDFLSRMEEEMNKVREQELEEEKKPLEEKIKSKNWKVRKNAYTEILAGLKAAESRTDKIFLDFAEMYTQIIDDPHAGAQETALDVIKQLFENYEYAGNMVPEIFRAILEKCYTSSRAALKNKAKEILVIGVEVSSENNQIIEVIKSGLENKNPKIGQASVNILTYLISQFGSFKIEFRGLIPNVEKLSENSSPAIRSDVLDFYKELYKWIRESIKPYVNRLKEAHQKDLEKSFDEINSKWVQPVPTKFLKNDKNRSQVPVNSHELNTKMLLIQEEETMFKNTEAVELFQGKFNDAWAEDLISNERKWIEKKEMLDNFLTASNVLKINNSGRAHIISAFNKLLKDSNINVVNAAILCINNMAKGLRKDFLEAKDFLITLIEKLKEKREKVISDIFVCLDSLMTHCVNFDEVIDDLRVFISNDKDKSQTVQMKERFCVFIQKSVLKTYIAVLRKVCKPLAEIMFKLSDDASADVRNAALTTIGVIKSRVGEMSISNILNEISDIKKKKVDEASVNVAVDSIYDKDDSANNNKNIKKIAVTKEVSNNNIIAKKVKNNNDMLVDVEMTDCVVSNSNTNNIKNIPMSNDYENNIKTIKPNIMNDIEMNPIAPTTTTVKQLSKSNSTNNMPKITAKPTQPARDKSVPVTADIDLEAEDESSLSNEDVESSLKDRLGAETTALFNDTKWENRKNGFIALTTYVQENSEDSNKAVDLFLRFIKMKLKDYKENNFNIIREALAVIHNLCEFCSNFSKKHCVLIIKKTCEKIGDNKLKQSVLNLFIKFMEYHGPKYITNILLKHMTNNVKSPSVLKESASFFEKVIEDFGVALLPVKEIVDFSKYLATNSNPQLRNAATSLLCMIYKYLGPNIKKFLNDIKEATLKVIESEFEKITVVTGNEQSKAKYELKGAAAEEAQATNGNLLDNLFPRIDISKKINSKIIKDLNEGKWQLKREAIETLEKILVEANLRVQPNGLNELVTSLKNKLDDGNKSVVRSMLQFITKLVEALGNTCRVFSKSLITPVLRNLSDKQTLLREDVIKCLEKWSDMIGFENILNYSPPFLLTDNFELRTDLLKLILKYKASLQKFDCKEIIPGVLACLLDKTPSIRSLAEDLAKEMLRHININNFYAAMKDYKPAIATTIKGVIEKYASLICIEQVSEGGEGINMVSVEFKPPVERSVSANQKNNANVNVNVTGNINNNNNNNKNSHNNVNINVNKQNLNQNINNVNKQNLNNVNKQNLNQNNKRDSNSSSEGNDSKSRNKKINTKNNATISTAMPNIKPINTNEISPINSNTNNPPNKPQIKVPTPLLIPSTIKINQKNKRLELEKKLCFPIDYVTQDFDTNLKSMLSQFINKAYVDNAFSNDVAKFNALFVVITQTLKSDPLLFNEVSDLWLKWILIRNLEMNNNLFFNNIIFDFLKNLFDFLKENECLLHETENKILIEILVSKVFTINSQAKGKAKQFFTDFASAKLFKYDVLLEMLCDKFNLIFDLAMKAELIDLIKNVSSVCKYNLEDKSNVRILLNMYQSVSISIKDENMKKRLYEIVKECYNNCEDKEVMNKVLERDRDLSSLIERPMLNVNPEYQPISSMNFSRSPVLTLQQRRMLSNNNNNNLNIGNIERAEENSSKESLYTKPEVIDQNYLSNLIEKLYSSNINEKIKMLLDLNDIFTNKYNECAVLLEKNIDLIIKSFKDLLNLIFSQTLTSELIDMLKYLLTVFYKAALTKDVIEHCNMETIYNTFEEILRSILYEGLEGVSFSHAEEGKKVIKSLNALILKLMENFKPTFTFISFIKLIQNYRGDNSRICSLSIKCLLKLSNIMPGIINNLEIEQILLAIFEFIFDFEKTNPELATQSQNEEMCLKILRTIIHEIIKIKNEGIWNYYKMAIERNNLPDKHLKRWIQLILRSKNGISMPSIGLSAQSNISNLTMNSNLNFSPMVNIANNLSSANKANNFNFNNAIPNYDNELKFYTEKLNSNKNEISDEKIFYEIIAILKRNKLSVEFMKDKISQSDYDFLTKVFAAVSNTENSNSTAQAKETSQDQDKENLNALTSNKIISNFVEKDSTANILIPNMSNMSNINNINNMNNMNNINSSFNSLSNLLPVKILNEYRNRLHVTNERSEAKNNDLLFTASNNVNINNSPSPIKPIHNDVSLANNPNISFSNNNNNINMSNVNVEANASISIENRKQYLDNFMKNKEILKNNTKRDFSSELRTNNNTGANITSSNSSSVNHFDKLAEMKKRLEMLRSQKY